MFRTTLTALAVCAAFGCSALIDPDPSRLGGEDAGREDASRGDAGRGDASRGDAGRGDAAADGGADTGMDASVDSGPPCPGGCDDGVACTHDRCESGRCVHTPDDASCEDDERCAPALGCVPRVCTRDAECDDGLPCNGQEVCDGTDPSTGCGPGVPLDCDDGVPCTLDGCADAAGGCVHEARDTACDDGVACTHDRCDPVDGCEHTPDDALCDDGLCFVGGVCDASRGCVGSVVRDCRDGDPCTADDCDPATGCFSTPRDDDMDGFPTAMAGGALCAGGTDCNDDVPEIHPGAVELCNSIDDDCDMSIDEGMACTDLPDDCGTAQPIPLAGTPRRGIVRGAFAPLTDDYVTLCRDSRSPDAVYYVDVPPGRYDVRIDTLGSAVDTVLAVTESCGSWDYAGKGCNDDIELGAVTDSRIWVHGFGAVASTRRIYILVEPYNRRDGGAYTLNVQLTDAASDVCPTVLDIGEGGTVVGSAGLTGVGVQQGSCQLPVDFAADEGVFSFRPRPGSSATFEVRAEGFVPAVYVRDRCGDATSEVACVRGDSNEASLDVGSGHFVFVDGMSAGSRYTLTYNP